MIFPALQELQGGGKTKKTNKTIPPSRAQQLPSKRRRQSRKDMELGVSSGKKNKKVSSANINSAKALLRVLDDPALSYRERNARLRSILAVEAAQNGW